MQLPEILKQELAWLEKIIKVRIEFPEADLLNFELNDFLAKYPNRKNNIHNINFDYKLNPPALNANGLIFADLANKCSFEERILLILTLSSYIEPGFIDKIFEQYHYKEIIQKTSNFQYLTGLERHEKCGTLPTGLFWIYLFAGSDMLKRLELIRKISNNEIGLVKSNIVSILPVESYDHFYGGILRVNQSIFIKFLGN